MIEINIQNAFLCCYGALEFLQFSENASDFASA